jgi:GT2 family glycosyltransferase
MISIIIPLKQDQGYLKKCLESCFQQDVPIEVIVLPDDPLSHTDSRIIQEATGPVSPAKKRNRGVQLSKGEILAFIDDDTQPQPGWLKSALECFKDPKVGAVGGPSVTPPEDPFWAQVSGTIYESWMMSAGERLRYLPMPAQDVQDFPSCNLLVRRSVFDEIGGFGTDFWPGEDTEFCLALVKKGYRIRYDPRSLIFHHRRPSLARHFHQLANYGLHRGYFAKRFPETSRRLQYFIPSLFVMSGTALALLTILGSHVAGIAISILTTIYLLLLFLSLLSARSWRLIVPSMCGIFLSHCIYGLSFIRGLFASQLPEEKQ